MIILDTNVLSEPLRPSPDGKVLAWLDAQRAGSLFVTAVSLAEMRFGAAILPDSERKTRLIAGIEEIASIVFAGRCIPFDEAAARAYGQILPDARRAGHTIALADGLIAAIAKAQGFAIATRDRAPFKACQVPVIDPWQS